MFSEPIIGEKFFGRHEILELLSKRVSALKDGYRQNIALTGQSLVGKSSIILHFLHTIKDEGFVPIYVEVVKEPFRSFANKFIATMLYNALACMGESADVDMDKLIQTGQKIFPKTSLAIRQVNLYIDKGQMDDAYMSLLGLTSILKDESRLSSIVILDEFDNLEHVGVKNPFLIFGKVIMVQKDTMYMVSSSRNRAIRKIISEKLSLLFGNFELIKVANFDLKAAGEFIDAKLSNMDIEGCLKKFIIVLTDGNPFYLDKITSRAKETALERMSSYIDREDVISAVLDLVYNANGIIHQYLLSFLLNLLDSRNRDNCMSALISIANGRNKRSEIAHGMKVKHGDMSKMLDCLLEQAIVSKNGVFYRIDDAMLEFWLKMVYQKRKGLLVDGAFDRVRIFSDDVRAYIDSFIEESQKEAAARLEELFSLFTNELVCIDSKHIRLPHFTRIEIKTFPDSKPCIACSSRGNLWIVRPHEYGYLSENDVVNYIKNIKSLGCKISNRIIISLGGVDENAKLLAKELKISIWDGPTVNMLLHLYGRKKMVIL